MTENKIIKLNRLNEVSLSTLKVVQYFISEINKNKLDSYPNDVFGTQVIIKHDIINPETGEVKVRKPRKRKVVIDGINAKYYYRNCI